MGEHMALSKGCLGSRCLQSLLGATRDQGRNALYRLTVRPSPTCTDVDLGGRKALEWGRSPPAATYTQCAYREVWRSAWSFRGAGSRAGGHAAACSIDTSTASSARSCADPSVFVDLSFNLPAIAASVGGYPSPAEKEKTYGSGRTDNAS